ncbi:hypothetical protein HNR46_004136 [Haloferula luteola]|uniref:Trimeric autotransporter adhesin YadA-like head domain-containing protein n=1 Tax=Haloferula luteola TaxID=595692 RepID=A0A840V7B8_9BACT|nr:hypothetical protein [Haloferula luteola]MBB5353872.1 hypothetical protein [Haloferula luteola]
MKHQRNALIVRLFHCNLCQASLGLVALGLVSFAGVAQANPVVIQDTGIPGKWAEIAYQAGSSGNPDVFEAWQTTQGAWVWWSGGENSVPVRYAMSVNENNTLSLFEDSSNNEVAIDFVPGDGSSVEPSILIGGSPVVTESELDGRDYLPRVAGTGATAGGSAYFALGDAASASGTRSLAIGDGAVADGTDSLALGAGSDVGEYGEGSVAFGGGIVNAAYSMAFGAGQSYGAYGLATTGGVVLNNSGTAIGGLDTDFGNWPGSVASGLGSASIGGIGSRADGFSSFASGFWTKAVASHSVALGSLNIADASSSTTTWVETDPLFELGNGNAPRASTEPSSASRSNAIATLKNGQTTLENKFWDSTAPKEIPANATEASGGTALVVKGHTRLMGNVVIDQPQGDILLGIFGE